MATPSLSEIESAFARLPPESQLSLLERLVHQTRTAVARRQENWDGELCAMSLDPEIQRELSRIATEFRATEADKLAID